MLYIQNGVKAPNMTNTGRSFKDFIQTYHPRNVSINNDNKGKLKASQQLAFSGRLVDDTHKIESVLERDLIALDLDFIHSSIKTKDDLFKLLKEPLGGLNWYLYPTISNGLGNKLKYRLIIPTPRLRPGTYQTLAKGLNYYLLDRGILSDVDPSNWKINQLFGMPVKNQFSEEPLIKANTQNKDLDKETTEKLIQELTKFISKHERAIKWDASPTASTKQALINKGASQGAILLNQIVPGIPQGQRNNTMYSFMLYWLKCGMDATALHDFASNINALYFKPPLDNKELENILASALKGHIKIIGGVYNGKK